MKYKKTLLILFLAVLVFNASMAVVSYAKNYSCNETSDDSNAICFKPNVRLPGTDFDVEQLNIKPNSIAKYIVAIYNYGASVAGIIAMFILVLAGYKWLFAAGSSDQIGQAKDMITGVFVGLILLFGGHFLLKQISVNLVEFKPIDIEPIEGQEWGNDDKCSEIAISLVSSVACGKSGIKESKLTYTDDGGNKVICMMNQTTEGSLCLQDQEDYHMGTREKPCPSLYRDGLECKAYKTCEKKIEDSTSNFNCYSLYEIREECLDNTCLERTSNSDRMCGHHELHTKEPCISLLNASCSSNSWCSGINEHFCCDNLRASADFCRCNKNTSESYCNDLPWGWSGSDCVD